MARDFYADGDESPTPAQESKGATETTLIPKSMCPGMDVGDKIEFRIVASRDSEYEVEYTGADKEEEGEEAPELESEMPPEQMGRMGMGGPPAGMGMME